MNRVVIAIQLGNLEGTTFRVHLDEPHVQAAAVALPFEYSPADAPVRDYFAGRSTLADIGDYLLGRLRRHPAIDQAIIAALDADLANPRPIFIRMPAQTEQLPWEALWTGRDFLALDQRWPIARMGLRGDPAARPFDFAPPLRVMAVLAASGVAAQAEWEALFETLRRLPFRVAIHAFVAEDALQQRIAATQDPNVDLAVAFVPPSQVELRAALRDVRPNLLHLFSHGRVDLTSALVLVATRDSWPDGVGDLVLDYRDLVEPTIRDSLWLATLNCCQGAAPGETGSLASDLVANGVPAVAAMREPVGAHDANVFCRQFYGELVRLLGAAVPGTEVELDLSGALYLPRTEICRAHAPQGAGLHQAAPNDRAWSLPVMYIRSDPVKVLYHGAAPPVAAPEQPETPEALADRERARLERISLETRLRLLRDLVAAPISGTPQAALDQFRAETARLEALLYPAALQEA